MAHKKPFRIRNIRLKFGWCLRHHGRYWEIERGNAPSWGRWGNAIVLDNGNMWVVYGWLSKSRMQVPDGLNQPVEASYV